MLNSQPELLIGRQKRKRRRRNMESTSKIYTFNCAECGRETMNVRIKQISSEKISVDIRLPFQSFSDDPHSLQVVVDPEKMIGWENFFANFHQLKYSEIIESLERGDIKTFISLIGPYHIVAHGWFNIITWCSKCNKFYCRKHWKVERISRGIPGYDWCDLTCPQGHFYL